MPTPKPQFLEIKGIQVRQEEEKNSIYKWFDA